MNGLYGYLDTLGSEGTQTTLPLRGYNYRHCAAINVLLAREGCWLNTNEVDIVTTNWRTLTRKWRIALYSRAFPGFQTLLIKFIT